MSNDSFDSDATVNRLQRDLQPSAPSPLTDARAGDPTGSTQSTPDVENARQIEPSPVGSVVCARCQTSNPTDAELCSRCKSFLPANQLQRTHGVYAKTPPPADLREKVDELRAGVIADRGGESELSTLELSYVEKLGDIDVTIRLLTHDIAVNGLLTKSGGVRGVYDKLLAGLAAFDRYAQRVGVERRPKGVHPLDAVRAAVIEANRRQPPQEPSEATSDRIIEQDIEG